MREGALLSEAFRAQSIFPNIYDTSIMAGEKSGSLVEVLERYIAYQKLSLAVRKKVLVSLMYPSVLIVLVILLLVIGGGGWGYRSGYYGGGYYGGGVGLVVLILILLFLFGGFGGGWA